MKKIFTLIAALMATVSMSAQGIAFVSDKDTLATDTTITMDYSMVDEFDEVQVPLMDISILNLNEDDVTVNLTVTIDEYTNGSFMCCLGGTCKALTKAGSISINNVTIGAGEEMPIERTEWAPEEYGTQFVKFTASTGSESTTLYVNFVYADPAGINEVNANANLSANTYNIIGQRVNGNTKGLVIKNGRKFLVK